MGSTCHGLNHDLCNDISQHIYFLLPYLIVFFYHQTPSRVENVHWLPEAQHGYKKWPLPAALHWWNVRVVDEVFFLLFSWWVFRSSSNSHPPWWSRKTTFTFPYEPMLIVECHLDFVMLLHLFNGAWCLFLLHDWGNHGSFHGRHFYL
jgi:hypothetical protein